MNNKDTLGIYIHIPFCKSKCSYCDFISFKNQNSKIEQYIDCLIKELQSKNWNEITKKYEITTIYIGGGTPSYIEEKFIIRILETLNNITDFKNVEITIEINPGTVTKNKLQQYKLSGINRLSIGLQSTKNELLKKIGRIHTFEDFLDTYTNAENVGFNNINVDLMIGLPNQNISDIKHSLKEVVKLNPNHISVYSLILEESTALYENVKNGIVNLPSEELERQMYWYTKNFLELNGYNHYEISNFCKIGNESKHNLNCWEQKQYLGFGVSAHSYFGAKRYSNTENLEEYINNAKNNQFNKSVILHESQTNDDMKKEYMLLGLRKLQGVNISTFKEKFVENPVYLYRNELSKLVNDGLLIIDGDFIKLTNKGLDLANLVWEEFV